MQCDTPELSGLTFLFRFNVRWMPGVIHGEGTFEFTAPAAESQLSFDVAERRWVDRRPCEHFMFWKVHERDVYEGTWENNLPHGQGSLLLRGGSYEGTFSRGAMTGKGTYRSCDCAGCHEQEYVGNFCNGHFHGHETLNFASMSTEISVA